VGYIFAADSIYASQCNLKQTCLKIRASMLNDSTRKTVFNTKWLFKVICFDVDENPLGDYILRHNNFCLIYELWKDIATTGSKNGKIFDDPTLIKCPLSINQSINQSINYFFSSRHAQQHVRVQYISSEHPRISA